MRTKGLFFIAFLLLPALASSTVAFPAPQPTALPPSQPPATSTPGQSLTLTTISFNEDEQTPPYKITAVFPGFVENDNPRAAAFNTLIHDLVMGEVTQFKNDTLQYASNPPLTSGSSFDVQYAVLGQRANFLSIKFDISGYADGAAHPYHYSRTVDYDLEQSREIMLDEIFLPDSNYLQKISDYCKAELATRDIAFDMFSQGADPAPENYRRWNISNEGLIITFDEYQVAPYAAGSQIVVIPFGELAGLIDDQGPISSFLR